MDRTASVHSSDSAEDVSREGQRVKELSRRTRNAAPRDQLDTDEDLLEDADEPSVIVQLANRVQDGTRCRIGSLDMCIQGKCQVS